LAELVDQAGVVRFDGQIIGAGGATTVYVQAADPGAVGAGLLWVDTTGDPVIVSMRDAGNAGWVELLEVAAAVAPLVGQFLRVASGEASLVVDDGAGAKCTLRVTSSAVEVLDDAGVAMFTLDAGGAFSVLDPGGAFAQVALSPGQSAANKNVLAIKNGAGASIFQVRGDGTVHIPAGKAVVADL
jgi:hypothetical protein